MRKFLKINFVIAVVMGFVFGAAFLFIGLDHNAQGEFYNIYTGEIDVIYIAMLFFSWVILAIIIFMLFGLVGYLACRLFSVLAARYRY
jgi:hypothetical protein